MWRARSRAGREKEKGRNGRKRERERERFEGAPHARKQFKMMPRRFSNFKSEKGKRRIPVIAMFNAREYLVSCAMQQRK
jgi:hypothetical protein